MSDALINNLGLEVPIQTQRGTDLVIELDGEGEDLTGYTCQMTFSGASSVPPTASAVIDGTAMTFTIRAEDLPSDLSRCRYRIVLQEPAGSPAIGLRTPLFRGLLEVLT
jgi:hypothetical protein